MPLSEKDAVAAGRDLLVMRSKEKRRLDRIHSYLTNTQRLSWLPASVPTEVRELAKISRVNMLKFVVKASVQAMYVDGFRRPRESDNEASWETWQRNRMDARQTGVHRAAVSYGAAYVTVLPGDPVPVMRGRSPRDMTAAYGDDDDWPVVALEKLRADGMWRLYDDTSVYTLKGADDRSDLLEFVKVEQHDAGVTPVVRVRDTDDLDDPVTGAIEPLLMLQDQINVTTFGLMVAQHYGAFRQRYVIGWLAESETEKLKASASKLWTFEDGKDEVQVGEFEQTALDGYIASREASLRHLATVSQTPAHELLGQLVNLSAEALAAAEASHMRAITETETVAGEAWEQALGLAGEYMGQDVDPLAEVRWRDTESRSLAQVADALGKMATMLNIPAQELWERIPGVSQTEVDRWKAAAASGDALGNLTALLDRQAGDMAAQTPAPTTGMNIPPEELKQRADALGVLIRAGVQADDAARRAGLEGVEFVPGLAPTSLRDTGAP